MPVHPFQSGFVTGEISDFLDGRVEWAKYQHAAKCLQNFVVRPQGGVARRAGLVYLGEVKDSTKKVRLVKFEFNVTQAYVLEFGDLYIRVWANRGRVLASEGGPQVEIASPYQQADLMALRFDQSADVLYIAHTAYPPMKFQRTAANVFALVEIAFIAQPGVPLAPGVEQPVSGTVTIMPGGTPPG
jgi:hypothetical protein